jgi:hypothetical protein
MSQYVVHNGTRSWNFDDKELATARYKREAAWSRRSGLTVTLSDDGAVIKARYNNLFGKFFSV